METLLACDPGAEGAVAVFYKDEEGWYLHSTIRNDDFIELTKLEPFNATAIIENNHGIRGQQAKTTFAQGYNQGLMVRTLELLCGSVQKITLPWWQSTFKVPVRKSFPGNENAQKSAQKSWTHEKAQKLTDMTFPKYAGDCVAIGLAWIKEYGNVSPAED